MRVAFFCALICAFFMNAGAQKPVISEEGMAQLKLYEDTIALLSYAVINDSLPEHRFGATKKLIPTLVAALKTPNSFHYPFSRVQSISIQYPADSTFRVFTWQLYVDVNEYRYYGAIQMNNAELQLFPLIDRSFDVAEAESDILPPEKWYGALYYSIKEFDSPQGKKYLLFGFDGYSFFNKRKVIDVLSFLGGKPLFGAPVFYAELEAGPVVRNRLLFEYTADAMFTCNYDLVSNMIVHDHLVEIAGLHQGQETSWIPDGSYEGYQLENGIWKNILFLENQILDEPPRPFPILEERDGRDLLGRRKNKN